MTTLSTWAGKKGFCLAATFSAYTFAFMLGLNFLDYKRQIQSSSELSSTLSTTSNDFIEFTSISSRQPTPEVPVRIFSLISPVQSFSKKITQETRPSLKIKLKRTERKDSSLLKINKNVYENIKYFREKLQEREIQLLRQTVEVFDFLMTKYKINYFMYGGTLIGSYRHHGLVPWDDDLDVLVPFSARTSMFNAFRNFSKKYILNTDWAFSWKLFSVQADPIRGYNWKWPYLDIFFYAENKTHIWDVAPQYTDNFVYLKDNVFPLRRRPFMNLSLLAPYKPRPVIDTNYDIKLCKSGKWIHKWERYGAEITIHCSLLYFKFPFVKRTFEVGGCKESLIHNGRVISYFLNMGMPCEI